MAKFKSHIFVCCNQRSAGHARGCCDPTGNSELRTAFKAAVKKRKLDPAVRANSAGCLDQCELGPTVVIYPQEIWYGGVTIEDVPRIISWGVANGWIAYPLKEQRKWKMEIKNPEGSSIDQILE